MKKIIHYLHIDAPAREVYEALTTEEGLGAWWSTDVSVDPGEGGIVDFRFVGDFNPDMMVTALKEDRLVAWRCVDGHGNWKDNTFSFELQASQGATGLLFTQHYAEELSDEVYGTYNFNWGYYLGSLKKLCETGKGTPYQPE